MSERIPIVDAWGEDTIVKIADLPEPYRSAMELRDAVEGLFRGGFIEAGTRDHNEWAYELHRRLEPLRALLSRMPK